ARSSFPNGSPRQRPPAFDLRMLDVILLRSMVCDEARLTEAAPLRFAKLDRSAAGGFGSVARELVDCLPHARGRSVKPRNYYIEGDAGLATEVPFFFGMQYVQVGASLSASSWGMRRGSSRSESSFFPSETLLGKEAGLEGSRPSATVDS